MSNLSLWRTAAAILPLRRSDGVVAYQLAVALDDALMGITQVVRGRDILTSTPRQLALLRLWGFEPPAYAHIPLLLDGQGERLAKRHQSLGVRELRRQGVTAAEIVGVLARLAGLRPDMRPLAAAELLADFRLEHLPRQDVCLRDLPCVPDWLSPDNSAFHTCRSSGRDSQMHTRS